MPLEFGLWRVDDKPVRVTTRPMPLESRLEELIEADPGILGTPLLLIGRQVPTQHGKFVDLLGMDAEGSLHVLELKRDRTPREVVAQVLDYGSWVQELTNEQIRDVYGSYARRRGLVEELDEAFALKFGGSPPEALNSTHSLTVVASEIDAATERIVSYLATGFQVPVNVLFFRYFEDEGRSYLARTWLIDDSETAAPSAGTKGRGKQEPWNGTDWYVSFGDESGSRSWDDALRYGFVSAGGGEWFSRTIRSLPLGARVFTHIPKVGYVGVGTVSGEPQPFENAVLAIDGESRRLADLPLKGTYRSAGDSAKEDGEDRREWVVPVTWERAVPRQQALWRPGFFANQNSACKLRARFTIDEVSRHFGVIEDAADA
ncbi:endonuclease NucS domain-containing protein [Streptomyces sp. DH24]|uniref:endonuclease NucS domain-containing protein n=1 Tax=Streptomyces sp. DH24 TaxID=3040123 RepID=UPI002442E200|nr:endonuclease NucS domain-containing protein [Streptomyces sp. DH24]MDG9717359.1 endonuclease NucS [Streptomyces sp. DH24]